MTRRGIFAVPLLLVAPACSGSGGNTQVTVRIQAEDSVLSTTARLTIQVFARAEGGASWNSIDDRNVSPAVFPHDVDLMPDGNDASRQFRVDARAINSAGMTVVHSRLAGSYIGGEHRLVELHLQTSCRTRSCSNVEERCFDGSCVDAFVDPATYAPFAIVSGSAGDASAP